MAAPPSPPHAAPGPFRRVLVVALSGIGDGLMATPLLQELGEMLPEARVEMVVRWPGARDLLSGNPGAAEVLQHDFIGASRLASLRFIAGLRRRRYDASLNIHTQGRRGYRVIARLIGARVRLSHRYENHGWLDDLLVTHSLPQDYGVHASENNARLLGFLGAPPPVPAGGRRYQIRFTPEETAWAAGFLGQPDLLGRPILGVHAGSGGTKNLALRRWPADCYVTFFQAFARRHPEARIALFGGPEERALYEKLAREAPPGLVAARSPSLRAAAAAVRGCRAFLSVDTVFMHIAAAVAAPGQFVIETPTLNPPVHPLRPDWTLIPNPGVGGRNLDYYRYDGRDIAGTNAEIEALMRTVTPEAVLGAISPAFT